MFDIKGHFLYIHLVIQNLAIVAKSNLNKTNVVPKNHQKQVKYIIFIFAQYKKLPKKSVNDTRKMLFCSLTTDLLSALCYDQSADSTVLAVLVLFCLRQCIAQKTQIALP